MKFNRIVLYISFILLAVMTVVLAVMTAGVHSGWSEKVYVSWPAVTLWILTAAGAAISIFRMRLYRKPVVFSIHLSLLIILAGGYVTHVCSSSGIMHLRIGDGPAKEFMANGGAENISLPCSVVLQRFEVVNYPGTDTPKDFKCALATDIGTVVGVSMNNPGNLMGWTFVIGSYDNDASGVTFNVSYDVWGVGLSYAGYILLALALIGYFFMRNTSWRISLRQLAVLLLIPVVHSADAGVNKDFADEFGKVLVNYNGRICPMTTVAKDFTINLTGGSASYGRHDMESVLAGFVFDFNEWKRVPIIKIKNDELKHILQIDGNRASYEQFFEAVSSGAINLDNQETHRKFSKEIDRFETVNMLVSGEILRIFPISDISGNIMWLSPTDNIPEHIEGDRWIFIRKYLGLLNEQVQRNDRREQKILLEALKAYQMEITGNDIPSDTLINIERLYDEISSIRWVPIVMIAAGVLLFLYFIINPTSGGCFTGIGFVFAIIATLFILSMIAMRWLISGHVPLSNGYETMQFLSLILLVVAILCRKSRLLLPMGILGSGLALGVSVLSGSGASISGLMPVLDSPLLSIHVVLVMMSYALFLLITLTGIAGIMNNKNDARRFAAMINVMLYPALSLLAMGIFVGAVWANISWGRYWGWDPKEVWALITLLTYSFAAHPSLLPFFRKPRFLLSFSIIAFITVIITYFGVNFILGGLHSYA